MWRLIVILLLAVPAPAAAQIESVEHLWLPHSIYGRAPGVHRIAAQMAQRNWRGAIAQVESLLCSAHPADLRIDPAVWRAVIGWLELFDSQPSAAIRNFRKALCLAPRGEDGNDARWHAGRGMARALALSGQYRAAIGWLRAHAVHPGSWCGNGSEAMRLEAEAVAYVWMASTGPGYQRLMAARAWKYAPRPSFSTPPSEQKAIASREATLLLGILLLRDQPEKGCRLLRDYLRTTDPLYYYEERALAQSHLDSSARSISSASRE